MHDDGPVVHGISHRVLGIAVDGDTGAVQIGTECIARNAVDDNLPLRRAGGKKALAQTGLDHTVALCTPDRFIQRSIVHISCINIHCYITPSCRFP